MTPLGMGYTASCVQHASFLASEECDQTDRAPVCPTV